MLLTVGYPSLQWELREEAGLETESRDSAHRCSENLRAEGHGPRRGCGQGGRGLTHQVEEALSEAEKEQPVSSQEVPWD